MVMFATNLIKMINHHFITIAFMSIVLFSLRIRIVVTATPNVAVVNFGSAERGTLDLVLDKDNFEKKTGSSSVGEEAKSGINNSNTYSQYEKPYFDDISPRNITTVVDETAVLKCRVKHKGDRTVSWIRKHDLHILSSNKYMYTNDQRFSIIHPIDSDDWDLKIGYTQIKDSGIYECQVNTEPKINLAVQLEVTERDVTLTNDYFNKLNYGYGEQGSDGGVSRKAARAKIMGSQEVHVKKGSTISLSCAVNVHASSIAWYHGQSIVDFDSARGGISLETEKTEGGTTSRLMLTRAVLRDSGNYTCVPTGAISASVQVHVLNGEHPAAMQTSSGVPCPSHTALIFLSILSLNLNYNYVSVIISNMLKSKMEKKAIQRYYVSNNIR